MAYCKHEENWAQYHGRTAATKCFSCGGELKFPLVFWNGPGGEPLWLHPNCAAHLSAGLARDAIEHGRGKALADAFHAVNKPQMLAYSS